MNIQYKKYYTRDLSGILNDQQISSVSLMRLAVFSYRADITRLIDRILCLKNTTDIKITIIEEPDHFDYDFAIVVSDYEYQNLPKKFQTIKHWILYTQEMADIYLPSEVQLDKSDWMIIRDLERMFLADTELSIEREKLRSDIDIELTGNM